MTEIVQRRTPTAILSHFGVGISWPSLKQASPGQSISSPTAYFFETNPVGRFQDVNDDA